MKKTVAACAASMVLFGTMSVAGAAEFAGPPTVPLMTLSPETGPEGTTFTVSGVDCGGDEVRVEGREEYVDEHLRSVAPEDDGSWSTTFTVSAGVDPGTTIRIEADCWDQSIQDVAQTFRGDNGHQFSYPDEYFEVTPVRTMALDPESGPAGSSFEVRGGTCERGDADEEVTVDAGGDEKTVTPDVNGDWTATFVVPADAAIGSTIAVEATCAFSKFDDLPAIRRAPAGPQGPDFDYTGVVFTVTGETTTTQGTTTTTAAGAVEATAATPTTATPTFTG